MIPLVYTNHHWSMEVRSCTVQLYTQLTIYSVKDESDALFRAGARHSSTTGLDIGTMHTAHHVFASRSHIAHRTSESRSIQLYRVPIRLSSTQTQIIIIITHTLAIG